MDDAGLDALFGVVTRWMGLEGTSLLATLAVVSIICRFIGKAIPDDVTGWKGVVRNVCKVIGLYISNRVTSGVSVGDVAKVMLDSKLTMKQGGGTVEEAARTLKSHWAVGIISLLLALLLLGGCTANQKRIVIDVTQTVCNNVGMAQLVLDSAAANRDTAKAQRLLDFLNRTCPLVLPLLNTQRAVSAGVLPIDPR